MSTAAKEKKNVAKGFQPLGDRVFVTYTEELDRTAGGIYVPDSAKESKVDTGYGLVKLIQKTIPAQLTEENGVELTGVNLVTLKAEWDRGGATQSESIQFYVYRSG